MSTVLMDKTRRVLYMAHPVSPTSEELVELPLEIGMTREEIAEVSSSPVRMNIQRAIRCLAWLRASFPETTFIAPWIASIQSQNGDDSPVLRESGLVDDCAVVERCDGIVLMGSRISSGMRREMEHGMKCNVFASGAYSFNVYDLTGPLDVQFVPVVTGMTFQQYMAGRAP